MINNSTLFIPGGLSDAKKRSWRFSTHDRDNTRDWHDVDVGLDRMEITEMEMNVYIY